MAWDFVMNFARDNNLQVVEACLLPERHVPADAQAAHKKPPEGGFFALLAAHPVQTADWLRAASGLFA